MMNGFKSRHHTFCAGSVNSMDGDNMSDIPAPESFFAGQILLQPAACLGQTG
jgi:hypothetical protein